ncbi:MAG: VOC family protein, partial [Thermoproteus sp.]
MVWRLVKHTTPLFDEVLEFYRSVLGLRVHRRREEAALLGALRPLVLLERGEERLKGGHIYHVAFRVPTREDLAAFVKWALRRFPEYVEGFADHLVSEAAYLTAPDGVGVEIYADRPRSRWIYAGERPVMDILPLDMSSLPAVGERALPPGTTIGHLH